MFTNISLCFSYVIINFYLEQSVFALNCRKTELASLTVHSQATLNKPKDIFVKISRSRNFRNRNYSVDVR